MNRQYIRRAGVAAAALWAALALSACSGCQEQVLDAADNRLSADPERAGKVGTVRALEVAKRARQVGERQMNRGLGLCEIGWEADEAAAVDFSVEIAVTDTSHARSWIEQGSWRRDADGRSQIEAEIEFNDGDHTVGSRSERVFTDEEGFWEWLGPEMVARHDVDSEAEQGWRREFSGRFLALLMLTSSTWEEVPAPGDDEKTWIPGGRLRPCAPATGEGDALSWRPMLGARVAEQSAEVTFVDRPEATADGESGGCRTFVGEYWLETGAKMTVHFQECTADPPETLERPEAERRIDVGRDQERAQMASQLEAWIHNGTVEALNWSDNF